MFIFPSWVGELSSFCSGVSWYAWVKYPYKDHDFGMPRTAWEVHITNILWPVMNYHK
jgi:hypothetical protein